jgi:hypothetical protein
MQIHRSCSLQLPLSAENGFPKILPKKSMDQGLGLTHLPMAKSKTPPRPLREALWIQMGSSGWKGVYLFGRALAPAPSAIGTLGDAEDAGAEWMIHPGGGGTIHY